MPGLRVLANNNNNGTLTVDFGSAGASPSQGGRGSWMLCVGQRSPSRNARATGVSVVKNHQHSDGTATPGPCSLRIGPLGKGFRTIAAQNHSPCQQQLGHQQTRESEHQQRP